MATLVVPTVNSERWLEPFLEFYRAAELDPVYAIDARTSDGTRELIESHGLRTIEVRGGAERVEALMPAIAAGITTPWCLRIDDDELPTAELIASVGRIAGGEDAAPVAFARAQLHYDAATAALERSHFIAYGPDAAFDCQTRLFRPLAVQFTERLHSPGFEVVRRRLAPTEAQILHFDWVLRSKVQRGAKLARYESQSADLASQCRHFTVPDLIPPAWHIFDAVPSPRLMAFARSIHLLAERAAGLGSG